MDMLLDFDEHEKDNRKRHETLRAALDRKLFAEAMELDFRVAELERAEGMVQEYSLSLTDHAANLRLIEDRVQRLEKKLRSPVKPN